MVLDPFMGSGKTGRVCDRLGRNFIGYDLYFFNFKRLIFKGKEEILFSSIYNQSRINKKVDNRTITEIFYDENLNYTTINKRKNESINKLNDKFKILLKTNKDIILREQSEIDKREIFYSINSKFL